MTPTSRIKALEQDAELLEEAVAKHREQGYIKLADQLQRDIDHIRALIAYDKAKQEKRNDRT